MPRYVNEIISQISICSPKLEMTFVLVHSHSPMWRQRKPDCLLVPQLDRKHSFFISWLCEKLTPEMIWVFFRFSIKSPWSATGFGTLTAARPRASMSTVTADFIKVTMFPFWTTKMIILKLLELLTLQNLHPSLRKTRGRKRWLMRKKGFTS